MRTLIRNELLAAESRHGPWAKVTLVLWVVLLLSIPLGIVAFAPADFLKTAYVSPPMHSLLEGFCAAVAFVLFAILSFATFYERDWSIFLTSLAFLVMGIFDGLHAIANPYSEHIFFVGFHTVSSLGGAVLLFLGVSLKVWNVLPNRGAKVTHLVVLPGLCVIMLFAFRGVMLHFVVEHSVQQRFSTLTYEIHNLSTAFYLFSAAELIYYYWLRAYIPALVIGGMLAALAESAYLFEFSTMWDVNWWLWHFVKAAFYFGVLTTASTALVFALRSVEASRLDLARANVKLTQAKRQLAELNSELHGRNVMIRDAVACFSLDNVLHAFLSALAEIAPGSGCRIVIFVAPDEAAESNRMFRSEWGGLPVAAEPFPEGDSDGEQREAPKAMEWPGPVPLFAFPLISERVNFGEARIEMAAPDPAAYKKIRAAVREIGPLVQSSLRNFHLAKEARFRSTLNIAVGQACSARDAPRVLSIACQEIIPLVDADWACIVDGSMNVFASAPDMAGLPEEVPGAENVIFADQAGGRAPEPPQARRWRCETAAFVSFPFWQNEAERLVLIACRRENVEFSAASLSKGELLVRQLAITYANAVNYRRVVDMNHELEVQREIRARSERLATLGQLAACVAHEVRNPLGAITNCLSILGHERNDRATIDNVLEIIRGEVARLDRLTRDFLAIGSRPNKLSVVRLDEMLDRVSRAVHQYINYEGLPVQLDAQFDGEGGALLFDSDGLEIVLWNLVLNAVQAVSGQGHVRVALRQRAERIFLAVIDNGRGIAAGDQQLIFEPFRSTRASGAGLGLAIIGRYLSHWGGKIKLKSTVGRGTAFLLFIPLPSNAYNAKKSA